jgi:hypothetical protein
VVSTTTATTKKRPKFVTPLRLSNHKPQAAKSLAAKKKNQTLAQRFNAGFESQKRMSPLRDDRTGAFVYLA